MAPSNPFYQSVYGVILIGEGNTSRAIALLEKTVRESPKYALVHYHLGRAQAAEERWAAATVEFETAIRLKPDLSEAYYHLSRVYRKLGRPDEAARALEKFRKSRAREDTEREHLLRMVREQQEAQ